MKKYIIHDKRSVKIDKRAKIGSGVVFHENVIVEGECEIGDNVEIFGNSYILNSKIGSGSKIVASFIEESEIGRNNSVGPFTRIRPGSKTGEGVKLGNFVEIKNSVLGDRTKAAHLAYIGDADVGADVNIGCGAIFVNYNGREKSRIIVGDGAFIGSNCNLIAPIEVAKETYICAGTTLCDSTQPQDFVIGRVKPTIKENRAGEYLKER